MRLLSQVSEPIGARAATMRAGVGIQIMALLVFVKNALGLFRGRVGWSAVAGVNFARAILWNLSMNPTRRDRSKRGDKILKRIATMGLTMIASYAIAAGPLQMTQQEAHQRAHELFDGGPAYAHESPAAKKCLLGTLVDKVFSAGATSLSEDALTKRMTALLGSKEIMSSVKRECAFQLQPFTDLDDVKLDAESLEGRRLRVRAKGQYVLGSFLLKKSDTDMSPMAVEMSKVSRDQRRDVIQRCSNAMSSCQVTVIGTVGKVRFQFVLIGESIHVDR